MPSLKSLAIWATPITGLLLWLLASTFGMPQQAAITLAITWVTAVWWMTGAIPIPAASLVPIALLPFFGILPAKTIVAQSYGHPLILLLLGGFLLSKSLEQSGVHRRLALAMVGACGGSGGKGLILGFMIAGALLSMWISNTATTLMLLPIALAILANSKDQAQLAAPLMLGIAYSCSIGGLGSPIGTPPNLVFIEQYREFSGIEMSFVQWMSFGVPIVLMMIPLVWLWLTRNLHRSQSLELPESGPWSSAERRTLLVFALTAIAWITRSEPFGGWSAWLHLSGANDASVAFIGVLLLFVIPNGQTSGDQKGRLLDAKVFEEIPWGILLLFGGGICLAAGIKESGLSGSTAALLSGVGTLPILVIILLICLLMTFVTELTSNTASTILMMPILGSIALANQLDPKLLMLPAALSASCAFMLPVATAPNAVVFGSGHLTVSRMLREGLVLNFMGAVVIGLYCWLA